MLLLNLVHLHCVIIIIYGINNRLSIITSQLLFRAHNDGFHEGAIISQTIMLMINWWSTIYFDVAASWLIVVVTTNVVTHIVTAISLCAKMNPASLWRNADDASIWYVAIWHECNELFSRKAMPTTPFAAECKCVDRVLKEKNKQSNKHRTQQIRIRRWPEFHYMLFVHACVRVYTVFFHFTFQAERLNHIFLLYDCEVWFAIVDFKTISSTAVLKKVVNW